MDSDSEGDHRLLLLSLRDALEVHLPVELEVLEDRLGDLFAVVRVEWGEEVEVAAEGHLGDLDLLGEQIYLLEEGDTSLAREEAEDFDHARGGEELAVEILQQGRLPFPVATKEADDGSLGEV